MRMTRVLAASGAFLLAVLWFDLMFDTQVLAHSEAERLPDDVLASIAGYYRRVTTESGMSWLVRSAFLVTFFGAVWQVATQRSKLVHWLGLALCGLPISLGALRIVPNAVRLATREDTQLVQSELARAIFWEHVLCLVLIAAFVVLQIAQPGDSKPSRSRDASAVGDRSG